MTDKKEGKILANYRIELNNIVVDITIKLYKDADVPSYIASIANISPTTKIILEKIREEFISNMNIESIEGLESVGKDRLTIKEAFQNEIRKLVKKYFPKTEDKKLNALVNYLLQESIGLGKIDILINDSHLEEIAINNHEESVWVYHRKFGWLRTNIDIPSERVIRHIATTIGRNVGKEITNLNPLMDAHLLSGDRVNATLSPISSKGNTITIRKFAKDPWTISKFVELNTLSNEAAALIWLAIENELSIIISGGTGSGKTSMLNVISNFFPPNQRIISIEDTRELVLPSNLHWVPMETRLANPEGKGGITMLDLLVNSLRMRPDRIIVGEIRRQKEAQVMLEAMHTGHSVYGTIHANTAEEVITRLINPPIDIPKPMISSISLFVVMNRNRRTGKRRVIQIAEVTKTGDVRIIMQYNPLKDRIEHVEDPSLTYEKIRLYTGLDKEAIQKNIQQKISVLKMLVEKKIYDVNEIGKIMAMQYRKGREDSA